jgi:hypothetical protein
MKTRGKQSKENLAYLAGVIDSDGYIGVLKSKAQPGNTKNPQYGLTVNVTNTSKVLMDWLVENFGGKVYTRKHKPGLNWKPTYNWILGYRAAKELLEEVLEFLVIKKDRAELGIRLMTGWVKDNRGTHPDELARREGIYQEFKRLNYSGLVQPERLNPEAPPKEDEAIV